MGNEASSGMSNAASSDGNAVVNIRRSTFRNKSFASAQPLQIISVDVKNKDDTWTQYTACLYRQKGGFSLEYGNVGDQFAVAMQLQSIDGITVDRIPGGAAVRIVQGNDPRHNKVTTFRFDSYDSAQRFQSTIIEYQRQEQEGRAGRPRAYSRGSSSGGGGGGYAGEPKVRRGISTEEERSIRELKEKYMATKPRRPSEPTPKSNQPWKQARAAKHVWNERSNAPEPGKKLDFSSFSASGEDEETYAQRRALAFRRRKNSQDDGGNDSQSSLLKPDASLSNSDEKNKKEKVSRSGAASFRKKDEQRGIFELEQPAANRSSGAKVKFSVDDVKRVLPQGSKIVVEFLDERNNVTMDVGSAKDASEWVNDIVNAQLAALQTNPTLYSGWAMLSIEGEERMRFMKLQGRTLYIFFDETMARPDMKLDLFYEGCEVKRKKFKHSGEFSDSQFWLQLSIPADSTSTDPEMGPMAFDMISVLCEVDSHSLHPWLALLEGAISGTYIAQGSRGRAALRSAPFILECLVKETLQTELSYVKRIRKLITDFINPLKQQLPEAASYLFGRSGIEVIYSVNMSYLCDLAMEIGNAALPPDVLVAKGQEVTAQYQCIYLAPDIVVLLLEVLEFCCKDPKSLTQIAERNGVLICCSQLHHSARRLKASRSTQPHHEIVQRRCKNVLDALQKHSGFSVDELKEALEHDFSTSAQIHNSKQSSASQGSHEYQALTLASIVAAETMGLVSHLKCYKNYFIHYDKIVENLHSLATSQPRRYTSKSRLLRGTRMEPQPLPRINNKEYQELNHSFCDEQGRPMLIESFLIEPVQRVPRYVMLVEQIYKQSAAILQPSIRGTAATIAEVASGTADDQHDDERLSTTSEHLQSAGVVDDSMIGDAVSVGGYFDGVLFEVLDGGSCAKVALTAPDGAFLDLNLFTPLSKLSVASDPFASHNTEPSAVGNMDLAEDHRPGTVPTSPGSPGDEEVDLVVEAVRQEFATLLANMETVLKQSKAVATYLDEAILQFAMQQRLSLIKALTPNWPNPQSTSTALNTVECQVLAECQFEVISASALTGQHSGRGIWHLIIVDDIVVLLAVMKDDKPKEFARPDTDPIINLNDYTILTRPLQRMHFVGFLERQNIKLSMSLTAMPSALSSSDNENVQANTALGDEEIAAPQIKRTDSVAIRAKEMLDDGIITQSEYESLVNAPRIEPVVSPKSKPQAAAAAIAEDSPRVGKLLHKPKQFFSNIGQLFDPQRRGLQDQGGPRRQVVFDPALVLKLEEINPALPFWAFDATLASWTVHLRLNEFPQYLACFLQHKALSRARRFSGTQPEHPQNNGNEVDGSEQIRGVIQRLSLSNEELIHSPTPEQFLYAASTPS